MLSFFTRIWVRRLFRQLGRGNIEPMMKRFAPDAVFVFPGDSSWAGEYRGEQEIRRWLTRFARTKMQFEVLEVAVSGAPWNMKAFIRYVDRNVTPERKTVYENAGVLFETARWFKVTYHEDYCDTQRVTAFDEYLASQGDGVSQAHLERRRVVGSHQ